MDTSIKINEDLLMNYWLFKESRQSVFHDFCPYLYLVRAGSAANSRLNAHLLKDPLAVTKIIYADADGALQPVVLKRLTRQLISAASMSADSNPELILPFRKECRRELRQRLSSILQCPGMGKKLKLMTLLTALCPAGYGLIHKIYAKLSGVDRKYEIS
jgi:hypothetical protein